MKDYNNMSVRDQKSNDNYTNYSAYLKLYEDYKSKVESFNNQIEAYNEALKRSDKSINVKLDSDEYIIDKKVLKKNVFRFPTY